MGDDGNRKKIAVTTDDAVTECPVEIETWSTAAGQAWLWVKAPLVRADGETALFLYYDPSAPDNDARVGDVGSAAARDVWSNGFTAVWHLAEGTGTAVTDSTANGNNGTLRRSDGWGATGSIDGAYGFNGVDDWAEVARNAGLMPAAAVTLEGWLFVHSFKDFGQALGIQWDNGGDESGYWMGSELAAGPFVWWVNIAGRGWVKTTAPVTLSRWFHATGVYDGARVRLYVDGAEAGGVDATGAIDYVSVPYAFYLGRYHDSNEDFRLRAAIGEARVSGAARSPAWVRATHESERNDLLDFGVEETY